MLVSREWLNRYIDMKLTPEELSKQLTMMGLETTYTGVEQPTDGGWIVEIDITPNRADCLSIRGIAREISALTQEPFREQGFSLQESDEKAADSITIQVNDSNRCPHYSARVIRDVTIAPSPKWLQETLSAVGMRSVNNVVDITNFILWDEGQPLHAFDYNKISEKKIGVRCADSGEKFETLDGKERILTTDDLLITDGEKGIALAGIMGGTNTEVSDTTKDILLESAYFQSIGIRKTSRRLGVHSESSHRFGRGVDPDAVLRALNRAAAMIAEIADGKISKGIAEHPRKISQSNIIKLRRQRLKKILGIEPTEEEVRSIMERLGFGVEKKGDEFDITVPSFRMDIEREIDLIEEVARVHGYSNIHSKIPISTIQPPTMANRIVFERNVKSLLSGRGMQEAINYSFIGNDFPCGKTNSVEIRNPINKEMSLMRQSLVPSLVNNALLNLNRGSADVNLFEIGHVYLRTDSGTTENTMLGICQSTLFERSLWQKGKRDFFDLKGVMEAILSLAKIDKSRAIFTTDTDSEIYHPGKSASINVDGSNVGQMGELHPAVIKQFDLAEPLFILEINLETLLSGRGKETEYSAISKYPTVTRDLALIIDETIDAREIEKLTNEKGGKYLKTVNFFDYYQGKQIPEGKKSLACTLIFESCEKTLTEEEVNTTHDEILDHLKEKIGATLR